MPALGLVVVAQCLSVHDQRDLGDTGVHRLHFYLERHRGLLRAIDEDPIADLARRRQTLQEARAKAELQRPGTWNEAIPGARKTAREVLLVESPECAALGSEELREVRQSHLVLGTRCEGVARRQLPIGLPHLH